MKPVAPKTRTFKVCVLPIVLRGLASDQEEPRGDWHEQADDTEADQPNANGGWNLAGLIRNAREFPLSSGREGAKQTTEYGWTSDEHSENDGDDYPSLSSHFLPP